MDIRAKVLSSSEDPFFNIKFTCETDKVKIIDGFCEVTRGSQLPTIKYDKITAEKLQFIDKAKLELEIMNKILEHILAKGFSRSQKGRLYLAIV